MFLKLLDLRAWPAIHTAHTHTLQHMQRRPASAAPRACCPLSALPMPVLPPLHTDAPLPRRGSKLSSACSPLVLEAVLQGLGTQQAAAAPPGTPALTNGQLANGGRQLAVVSATPLAAAAAKSGRAAAPSAVVVARLDAAQEAIEQGNALLINEQGPVLVRACMHGCGCWRVHACVQVRAVHVHLCAFVCVCVYAIAWMRLALGVSACSQAGMCSSTDLHASNCMCLLDHTCVRSHVSVYAM